jgi:hypothetical protein
MLSDWAVTSIPAEPRLVCSRLLRLRLCCLLYSPHLVLVCQTLQHAKSRVGLRGARRRSKTYCRVSLSISTLKVSRLISCVSVVVVHGLDGTRVDSWTEPRSGVCWLNDDRFVPFEIPDARIIAFGYNAFTALDEISTADTRQHGETLSVKLVGLRKQTQVRFGRILRRTLTELEPVS